MQLRRVIAESAEDMEPIIVEAVEKIEAFILQTTGKKPTPKEISGALTRYFVMNEIKEFIVMSRGGEVDD
jgi:hypothetical protein